MRIVDPEHVLAIWLLWQASYSIVVRRLLQLSAES